MRYRDLIDRLEGFEVGTLIVDAGVVSLDTNDGMIELTADHKIEVLNGDHYLAVTLDDCLSRVTEGEGWPLFAGLYARIK